MNQALADLVCSRFGEDIWEEIIARAGVEDDEFIPMEPYPDEITDALVGAASEVLDLTPSQVLEAFGAFFVEFTGRHGYGQLFDQSGETVRGFLCNLNRLHAQIQLTFPGLRPPRMDVEDIDEEKFLLHYHSTREGLAPMVLGLLQGLALIKNEIVAAELQQTRAEHGHDVFLVRVCARQAA
ncbi:MAG: heme NO-binding domain-containing protein [Myxococcota bacterium]